MSNQQLKQWGRTVVDIEKAALENLYQYVDSDEFAAACNLILNGKGKVIVMGMGKSGHVGHKIAATLASTGTSAFFVHPGEAAHGDLGMLDSQDIILTISNSGEAHEILTLMPVIKRLGLPVIAMTGNENSSLAKMANVHLCIEVPEEACPLGLAPTSSTTATLVMGDAIAVALLQANGFTAKDFALSHPGGSLGRKLLIRVFDIMHQGTQLPMVKTTDPIADALLEMSNKGLGMTTVVNGDGSLAGVFTDGDLRRMLDGGFNLKSDNIASVMTPDCITLTENILAAEALKVMEQHDINGIIMVNQKNQPIGALNMLDMVKAGVL
ncbi:KpsF/GutQ family sugar-phosphate isomerase [Paraferrimonas sp. SM1919]|uniref:KpsF/GutQ family sugar-phosphate isomerase n=1 Tax=Paraferrimonas sp. SM1919 TaxID=2662263 RepID=UPI001F08947F|nr:KpsF/GutQ family sugar-phosphate isomerase [Paraferrimonas sp. SM1919]